MVVMDVKFLAVQMTSMVPPNGKRDASLALTNLFSAFCHVDIAIVDFLRNLVGLARYGVFDKANEPAVKPAAVAGKIHQKVSLLFDGWGATYLMFVCDEFLKFCNVLIKSTKNIFFILIKTHAC